MTDKTEVPFADEVWNTLSRIDVGDHIQTVDSGSFSYSYLTWSWAWATLMNVYPESEFNLAPEERFEDGTVNVGMLLVVRQNGRAHSRFCWLPVMDRRNNAVVNPDARQINDSRMRCLVKAMAFCGLGLDLWTGSDMPVGVTDDPLSPEQLEVINGLLVKAGPDMIRFLKWLKADTVEEIPMGKFKQAVGELERSIKRKAQEQKAKQA